MSWKFRFGITITLLVVLTCRTSNQTVIRVKRGDDLIDLIAVETRADDLVADEATGLVQAREQKSERTGELKYSASYSSKTGNKLRLMTEVEYGTRTTPRNQTQQVLDFRIPPHQHNGNRRKVISLSRKQENADLKVAEAANSKTKKQAEIKKDDDDEKTLSQQVADGKYGLIQNEIFPNGSKRPGIISYLPNVEVPSDNRQTLGGLDKDEIWLAEDHVLVLKGGRYPDSRNNTDPSSWPPIDDYIAPPRQVKIPKRPKIPPPFPVQLTDDGPLEFVQGVNGSGGPPRFPFLSPPPGAGLPFPGQGFPFPVPNGSIPYPPSNSHNPVPNVTFPPNRSLPPFLANLPPGAAFLPPPGNSTDFDEDDPSIYYPPPYDFYYPRDNTTDVPPGPLVPGIILPPPPNFFAPLKNETGHEYGEENYEDNETEDREEPPPYKAPVYLPVPRKPTIKYRQNKRPYTTSPPVYSDLSNQIKDSTGQDVQSTTPITNVHLVYPEQNKRRPVEDRRQKTEQEQAVYIPSITSGNPKPTYYHPLPTTSPKPNHITLPKSDTLKKILPQEIYVVSKTTTATISNEKNKTQEQNNYNKYDNISPDIHPFRSLIKPEVTVSYVGKYGHLPNVINKTDMTTAAPRPIYTKQNEKENEIQISVTPVPVRPVTIAPISTTPTPSKATFYFYEEPSQEKDKPKQQISIPGILNTDDKQIKEFVTPKPVADIPGKHEEHTIKYVTSSTPIRQFLEETFHSSNILPNKPKTSHFVVPSRIQPGFYHEVPSKTKLNYPLIVPNTGTRIQHQPIKYHYVTEVPKEMMRPAMFEIENAGTSGVQKIKNTAQEHKKQEAATTYTTPPAPPPIITQAPNLPHYTVETHPPANYKYTTPRPDDGPFIPSNYYATANPQDLLLTPNDHTLVDDITKNYFTIFGQKITHSTTPITPTLGQNIIDTSNNNYVPGFDHNTKTKPGNVLTAPLPQKQFRRPSKTMRPSLIDLTYTTDKPTRPKSNFEQYLKEITGQDQQEYVEVVPVRVKKPKTNLGFIQGKPNYQPGLNYNPVSMFLNPPKPRPTSAPQYLIEVSPASPQTKHPSSPQHIYKYGAVPQYVPNYSTTLRPTTVEIEPQYVQHISSTSRPLLSTTLRPDHDFRQFLHEISTLTSPTTLRPIRISPTSLQYVNGVQYTGHERKPVSLESDILINYKKPLPQINPDSETIKPQPPEVTSNFQIVDPPDLTKHRPKIIRQYPNGQKLRTNNKLIVDVPMNPVRTKEFFQNLPNSGYFNPVDHYFGNSFVSYNLPGNGGHFYFLTPQAVERSGDSTSDSQNNSYSVVKTNESKNKRLRDSQQQINEEYPQHSYTNQDYLRRRRKKT